VFKTGYDVIRYLSLPSEKFCRIFCGRNVSTEIPGTSTRLCLKSPSVFPLVYQLKHA